MQPLGPDYEVINLGVIFYLGTYSRDITGFAFIENGAAPGDLEPALL